VAAALGVALVALLDSLGRVAVGLAGYGVVVAGLG